MFAAVLLVIVAAAVGLFIAGRVYVGLRNCQLDVKGVTYSWKETPVLYGLVLFGATMCLAVAGFCVLGLVGRWPDFGQ